jgi:hypothetical protein
LEIFRTFPFGGLILQGKRHFSLATFAGFCVVENAVKFMIHGGALTPRIRPDPEIVKVPFPAAGVADELTSILLLGSSNRFLVNQGY